MILTDGHLRAIIEAAKTVDYGSVTINISASAKTLDLVIENRVKIEKEPEGEKLPKKNT